MYRKLLILFGFVFILAGCSNTYDTKIDTYKTAVLEKDTEALIDIIEMEDEPLTSDEAEGYIALIHEQYDEAIFSEKLSEIIDSFKKGSEQEELSPKEGNDYSLLTVTKVGKNDISLTIPRYEVSTEFPEGQFPIKFGINDLTVDQPYPYKKMIGKTVPTITHISGKGKQGENDLNFTVDINFNKNGEERVILSGDLYAVEIKLNSTRYPVKAVSIDGTDITDSKHDEKTYYFKSDKQEVTAEITTEYMGKELVLAPVKFSPEFLEISTLEIEIPENELTRIEVEVKEDRDIELAISLLALHSRHALENESSSGMLNYRFKDTQTFQEYFTYLNKFADSDAEFSYDVVKAEPVGKHSDFTYDVEFDLKKDGKHIETNAFTFKFTRKGNNMVVEEYTQNK